MQVMCKKKDGNAEYYCGVCGQGFVMFWERETRSQRREARSELFEMLRRQHRMHDGTEAHPMGCFEVPSTHGAMIASVPDSVPVWEL